MKINQKQIKEKEKEIKVKRNRKKKLEDGLYFSTTNENEMVVVAR